MNDAKYKELRETSWRRQLTPAEEARLQSYLAAHAELEAEWEEELALTRQLQELPDAPISSNFTSLVLQAAQAEAVQNHRAGQSDSGWLSWLRRFAPRLGLATLTIAMGLAVVVQYRVHNQRQVVHGVKQLLAAGPVTDPAIFEAFEAIQELQTVSFSKDDDLLAALQ